MQFHSHFALQFFGQDWFDFWNYPLVSSENKEIKPLKVCINLQIGSILKSTTQKPRFVYDHLIIWWNESQVLCQSKYSWHNMIKFHSIKWPNNPKWTLHKFSCVNRTALKSSLLIFWWFDCNEELLYHASLTPCWSVLNFWKFNCKNQVRRAGFLVYCKLDYYWKINFEIDFCRLKIQSVELDVSN